MQLIISWGDIRADRAAVAAVNANLSIDADDWSDLIVESGKRYDFADEDYGDGVLHSNFTTLGNNKHFSTRNQRN